MPHTLTIGSIRCHILSDGMHHMDGGGFFGLVPRLLWQRVIEPDAQNLIPADTRCLLIESDAGPILVDTGHGDKLDAKARARLGMDERNERLLGQLRAVGCAPEDVAIVLLTHFHGDHVGGATCLAGGAVLAAGDSVPSAEGAMRPNDGDGATGRVVPTFPNARYIGQRLDLADALFPNERTAATYIADNFKPLLEAGRLEVVDGPQRLARGVRTQLAPGHTKALQVVWVEDGGERLLFLGDAANWGVHLERLAWVPSFDIDPMQSIETKRALRTEALESEALLVFQHDARLIAARLRDGARGPQLEPVLTQNPSADPLQADSAR